MFSIEITSNVREQAMYADRGHEKWGVEWRGKTRGDNLENDISMAEIFTNFLEGGYDRFVLYLEDTILVSPSPGKVVCLDVVTGATAQAEWTAEQVEAVCALAIGGDEWPQEKATAYYLIAEQAIQGWPTECRPIP